MVAAYSYLHIKGRATRNRAGLRETLEVSKHMLGVAERGESSGGATGAEPVYTHCVWR